MKKFAVIGTFLVVVALLVYVWKSAFLRDLVQNYFPHQNLAAVYAADIFTLTNSDRSSANLPPLTRSSLLDQAAQGKADDMMSRGYYSHTSPEGNSPLYWLDKVGYKYQNVGENLDLSYVATNEVVNSAWMNSPEHRDNILRSAFTEIGIGVASGLYQGQQVTFVVQEFASPLPEFPKPIVTLPGLIETPLKNTLAANIPKTVSLPPATPTPLLTANLYKGITNEQVRTLQKILNTHGFKVREAGEGSPGQEGVYFGPATLLAVIKFQVAKHITPAEGFVGPRTRAALNTF